MKRLSSGRLSVVIVVAGLVIGGCSSTASSAGPEGSGAAGGGGASAAAGGGGNASGVDACSLLTPAEIQGALGVAVKAGAPLAEDDPSQCEWDSQDDSAGVGVSLAVTPYDDTLWKTMSSAQQATAVQGLGEAAFKGYPHAGDLSIKQGGNEIDLGIVDFTSDQGKVDAADMTLAKLVLSRL